MGGANWLGSEQGSEAAWRAERASPEVERVSQRPRLLSAPLPCRPAPRLHSFTQASRLSEQVTEGAIEGLGGDAEGREKLKGHTEKVGEVRGGDSLRGVGR